MPSLPDDAKPLLDLLAEQRPELAAAIKDGIERGWLLADCRTCRHAVNAYPIRPQQQVEEVIRLECTRGMDDDLLKVVGVRPLVADPGHPVCRLYEPREADDAS